MIPGSLSSAYETGMPFIKLKYFLVQDYNLFDIDFLLKKSFALK